MFLLSLNHSMKNNIKIWLFVLVLLLVDRATKYAFYDLELGRDFSLIEPVFNYGISRGIAINRGLVLLTSVVGIWFFFYLWYKKHISYWIFILLIAGTLGNFFDRVFLGGVRDFISLWSFPVFNIADCYLTFAVLILIKNEIFPCNSKRKS